jgi:hypothetical protein
MREPLKLTPEERVALDHLRAAIARVIRLEQLGEIDDAEFRAIAAHVFEGSGPEAHQALEKLWNWAAPARKKKRV